MAGGLAQPRIQPDMQMETIRGYKRYYDMIIYAGGIGGGEILLGIEGTYFSFSFVFTICLI